MSHAAYGLALGLLLLSAQATALDWSDYGASAVVEVTRATGRFTCTGVAISPRVVLTAAHCAVQADSARVSFDFRYDALTGSFIPVAAGRIYIHPQYDPSHSLYANDFAALVLTQDLPPGIRVPHILPRSFVLSPGTHLETIGYGGRQGENRRTWTDVVFERSTAGAVFTLNPLSTLGDSGGPLFFHDGDSLYLVGIHSTVITDSDSVSAAAVDLRAQTSWLSHATAIGN